MQPLEGRKLRRGQVIVARDHEVNVAILVEIATRQRAFQIHAEEVPPEEVPDTDQDVVQQSVHGRIGSWMIGVHTTTP